MGYPALTTFSDICVEAKGNDCKEKVENHLNIISDRETILVFSREISIVCLFPLPKMKVSFSPRNLDGGAVHSPQQFF